MTARTVSVAGVQYLHQPGQRAFNIARAEEMIRAAPGHHLYVLPELASSGYGGEAFTRVEELAETDNGPSYVAFSSLARELGCHICYSFPKRHEYGITITAAVVDPRGDLVCSYDKWHVCQNGSCSEKDHFASGRSGLGIFTVNGIKVGICICYDIRFPELTRDLAIKHGISLLIHPGGWPRDEGFQSWHPFVITRAIENGIYVMSPNRAGSENGHSIFCPPYPDMIDEYPTRLGEEEAVLVGVVDPGHLARIHRDYPLRTDRRPELYG
ncbi:MAG: carbon-nitrogen hydrolase family protein [Acidobacteriota bacterium]|nr:carbon-nitrogen hydrolase family protein [Acidobacteriota bacterium]